LNPRPGREYLNEERSPLNLPHITDLNGAVTSWRFSLTATSSARRRRRFGWWGKCICEVGSRCNALSKCVAPTGRVYEQLQRKSQLHLVCGRPAAQAVSPQLDKMEVLRNRLKGHRMLYPDFCEAQLQAICNMDICRRLGSSAYPVIPSLVEENRLGWDSGFIIGRSPPPAENQKGCNFFVQYKLAHLVEGPRGGQYRFWGESYFRFKIPHERRDQNGYYDDYHQYHLLKGLTQRGYPTLYTANAVVDAQHLFQSAQQNIDAITASISVAEFDSCCKFVTYTQDSDYVMLHSEPTQVGRYRHDSLLPTLRDSQPTTFNEDISKLLGIFSDHIPEAFRIISTDLPVVENWVRLAEAIYYYTGITTYKWFA
jgi:hypothetical protein